MNTIDDLKAALLDDAATIGTTPEPGRTTGVRSRIKTIQRRRRTSAAVGAAALAAVVGLGVVPRMVDDPGTENRLEVAGHQVPETVLVSDFSYRFVSGTESEPGETELELPVEMGDRRRAVRLAVDELPAGGSVTLRDVDGSILTRVVESSRLDVPLPIGTGEGALSVEVTDSDADTVVGLALYERTDELPAGLASDGVVFREQVGDDRLVAGAFVDPATGKATFTVDGSLDDVWFATHCDSNGQRVFEVIRVDGEKAIWGRCDDLSPLEEDAYGALHQLDREGDGTHLIEIWTTDQQSSTKVVPFDGAVIGLGAYRSDAGEPVLDTAVDHLVEAAGRLWELDDASRRSAHIDSNVPVHVGFTVPKGSTGWLRITPEGGKPRVGMGIQGGGYSMQAILWPGQAYDLEIVDFRRRPLDGRVLIYRPGY